MKAGACALENSRNKNGCAYLFTLTQGSVFAIFKNAHISQTKKYSKLARNCKYQNRNSK
jgi:hypothetical protein